MAQKKLASSSHEERRRIIELHHPRLPVTRQRELLGLARASYYHRPEQKSDANLRLMRVIDETYLAYLFFGSRQMTRWLRQRVQVRIASHQESSESSPRQRTRQATFLPTPSRVACLNRPARSS